MDQENRSKYAFMDGLTRQQRRIAMLCVDGLSDRDIAQAAGISVWTVMFHLRAVYKKCGVRDRVGLLVKCLKEAA